MNQAMKEAWLKINLLLENPDITDLDIFLRTWQLALEASKPRSNEA